jgi:hypothetical protein
LSFTDREHIIALDARVGAAGLLEIVPVGCFPGTDASAEKRLGATGRFWRKAVDGCGPT